MKKRGTAFKLSYLERKKTDESELSQSTSAPTTKKTAMSKCMTLKFYFILDYKSPR